MTTIDELFELIMKLCRNLKITDFIKELLIFTSLFFFRLAVHMFGTILCYHVYSFVYSNLLLFFFFWKFVEMLINFIYSKLCHNRPISMENVVFQTKKNKRKLICVNKLNLNIYVLGQIYAVDKSCGRNGHMTIYNKCVPLILYTSRL